jgi:hypothetical protein
MVYRGRVEKGVVVFDEKASLAEGTEVSERLGPVVGIAENLPEDLAQNHDHYLYGLPKK